MTAGNHMEADLHMAMMKAEQLEEMSVKLSDLADRQFAGTMQNLSYGWKGENASAYLGKGAKLQSKMKDSAKELRDLAEELRSAAKQMCVTEENN